MRLRLSSRMSRLSGAATREILKLTSDPNVISFAGGMPGRECLPYNEVADITNGLLRGSRASTLLQYGTTDGLMSTREAICDYAKVFGLNDLKTENVLMISGGQQGLDLACKATLNKGDYVLVENPTYLTMLQIVNAYEGHAVGVDSCEYGLDITDLEQKIIKYNPKILYIVPTFSNPTGHTYTLENRKEIARLTEKYHVLVVEDDPYSRLRFAGEYVPSVKSIGGDNVVFVTSFSKIISPGLRVGAAIGAPDIIRKMEICKQGTDVHTPNLNQAIVEEFITKNLIDPHLEKVCPIYKDKSDKMLECIDRFMPSEFEVLRPEGGLFVWGEFAEGVDIDTRKMFEKAVERKVAYVYGDVFFADGCGQNTLRLNFSNSSIEKIEEGIKILGELAKETIDNAR